MLLIKWSNCSTYWSIHHSNPKIESTLRAHQRSRSMNFKSSAVNNLLLGKQSVYTANICIVYDIMIWTKIWAELFSKTKVISISSFVGYIDISLFYVEPWLFTFYCKQSLLIKVSYQKKGTMPMDWDSNLGVWSISLFLGATQFYNRRLLLMLPIALSICLR